MADLSNTGAVQVLPLIIRGNTTFVQTLNVVDSRSHPIDLTGWSLLLEFSRHCDSFTDNSWYFCNRGFLGIVVI